MNLRNALEYIPINVLEEQCYRYWKEEGVFFPSYAFGKLREGLLNTRVPKPAPYIFLVFPYKKTAFQGEGEIDIRTTYTVTVAFEKEINELCEKYGAKELVAKLEDNCREYARLLSLEKIPFNYDQPSFREYLPEEHTVYEVHWNRLPDMDIPALKKADSDSQMGRMVAAILFAISEMGFTKESFLAKAKHLRTVFRIIEEKMNNLKEELGEEFDTLNAVSEEEFSEDEMQKECRIMLFNLKNYTRACIEAIRHLHPTEKEESK